MPQREAAAGFPCIGVGARTSARPRRRPRAAPLGLQELLYSDPPHRANILSTSMRAVGIGDRRSTRSGQLWLTEDFGG